MLVSVESSQVQSVTSNSIRSEAERSVVVAIVAPQRSLYACEHDDPRRRMMRDVMARPAAQLRYQLLLRVHISGSGHRKCERIPKERASQRNTMHT